MKHKLAPRAIATATVVALSSSTAHAISVDSPNFGVDPLVIVWAASEADGSAPIVFDFIVEDGMGGTVDLIGGSAIDGRTFAGDSLIPTADSAYVATSDAGRNLSPEWSGENEVTNAFLGVFDTETPGSFAPFAAQDIVVEGDQLFHSSTFFIASNTPFGISGTANSVEATGDFDLADVHWFMDTETEGSFGDGSRWGDSAQNPLGTVTSLTTLSEMTNPTTLYESTVKTAASEGSIADQSVRFAHAYYLGTPLQNVDLSSGAGELKVEVIYTVYVL